MTTIYMHDGEAMWLYHFELNVANYVSFDLINVNWLIVEEEIKIEHRLTGLGSTSNEERRFTIVGTISSKLIGNTYDKEHSPCSITLSCPMPHLQ